MLDFATTVSLFVSFVSFLTWFSFMSFFFTFTAVGGRVKSLADRTGFGGGWCGYFMTTASLGITILIGTTEFLLRFSLSSDLLNQMGWTIDYPTPSGVTYYVLGSWELDSCCNGWFLR